MSKSVKKSLSLAGSTIEFIENTKPNSDINWSRSINDIVTRYALFVELGLPDLTDDEKMAIMFCYGGRKINQLDIKHEADMLHLEIKQSIENPDADRFFVNDKEQHDYGEGNNDVVDMKRRFCKKAKLWNSTQRLAILHHVESVWIERFADLMTELGD